MMKVRMKNKAKRFLQTLYDDREKAWRETALAEVRAATKIAGGRKQKAIWAFVRANSVTPFNTKVFFEPKDFEVIHDERA